MHLHNLSQNMRKQNNENYWYDWKYWKSDPTDPTRHVRISWEEVHCDTIGPAKALLNTVLPTSPCPSPWLFTVVLFINGISIPPGTVDILYKCLCKLLGHLFTLLCIRLQKQGQCKKQDSKLLLLSYILQCSDHYLHQRGPGVGQVPLLMCPL